MGISRKELKEMTLGEFWERHYFYEYSRADKRNYTRLIMASMVGIEEGKTLKDILHIPMFDDFIYDDEETEQTEFTEEEIAEKLKNMPSIQDYFDEMDRAWNK